ncbi:unnamed protein product, partial [Linum tenue]
YRHIVAMEKGSSTCSSHQLEEKKGDDNGGSNKTVAFHKLFTSAADSTDALLMTLGTIGAMGNGLAMPLMSILFGQLTDSFGQNQQSSSAQVVHLVSQVSVRFVYLAAASAVLAFLQVTCWMVTGERQAARIRVLYLQTILRQDIAFFDGEMNTADAAIRISNDTILIQDAMGEKVGKFIQLLATFIGGLVIAFIKGWLLTLVLLSSIPVFVVSGWIKYLAIAKMLSRGQTAYSKAANVVDQTIGSIRTVTSFTGEKQAIENYNKHLVDAYKSGVNEGLVTGLAQGMFILIMFCTYSMAIWFGGKMVLEKGYSGGEVISVLNAILTGSISIGQISPCLSAFAVGQVAAYKMFETIKRKPEIDAYDSKGKVFEDISGDIEFKHVCFSYPARPDEQIFNGFSVSIKSGTTAALVGQSGSGKSTVISLIERFYDPQAGEVLIDGINLKQFQLKWIRGKIGLVSQEPTLFTSSIKDNIAYGKEGASIEEIRAASQLANAAKFIDKLPQGLDTMVGEHGTQLSGGQKQRIAIARAILKNPRILLLDEATSALDIESEKVVQEALDRIMVNRTTLIVAHRLSTVENADMIAVIHHGRLVEKGSHTELLSVSNGAYSQLIRLQELKQEPLKDHKKPETLKDRHLSHSSSSVSLEDMSNTNHSHETIQASPTTKHVSPTISIKRLAHLNKPELPVVLAATIAAALHGVVLPIFSLFMARALKSFYEPPHVLRQDTKFWASTVLSLGFASLLVFPSHTYLFSVAGCRLIQRIRSICFEKVVHMEVGWFDEPKNSTAIIGARLSADATMVRSVVGDKLSMAVQTAASVVAGLVVAFSASWQLAFIVLALVPLIGINWFVQVQFFKGFSGNAKVMYEEASQVASDGIGSIRTVASFCGEEKVVELYREKCKGPIEAGIRQGLISGIGFGVSNFLLFAFYAISFYASAGLVNRQKASFRDVFQIFYALNFMAIAVSQMSTFGADWSKARTAAASIFEIIDRRPKVDPSEQSGATLGIVKGDIELRHIHFSYPSRPGVEIFRDLSLAIHSNKTVALVGESGSGKSTVIALLQRFYDPDSGSITLDGVDIQTLRVKWLRQQMGLVSQEPVLFNDTVRANIAYGKQGNATESEILSASGLANAHNFISSLQQGYDTIVGERGIQLSGGQKQRVAIARAMVKDPKILLLDEATSALDAESEKVVQDALERVMVNRTTVVVAHRLSTIKNADLIVVVKNGAVVEKGRHESLMAIKDGFYASLISLHTAA